MSRRDVNNGKAHHPSLSKEFYILTIVDDFSRSIWTFLLKHKNEAIKHPINFHKMIKTQFGKEIKRIRCDKGGEFASNIMYDFYVNEGIIL